MYKAPNGLGLNSSAGFTNATLNFGVRANRILTPPTIVQDAAVNTSAYSSMLNNMDGEGQTRNGVFDVGSDEINGTGNLIAYPLDSTQVGAGTPFQTVLLSNLKNFNATLMNQSAQLNWQAMGDINLSAYEIEWSTNSVNFLLIGRQTSMMTSNTIQTYFFVHNNLAEGKNYYRLKMMKADGTFDYSVVRLIDTKKSAEINIYPNPAAKEVNVEISGTINSSIEILLFDVSGKVVKRMVTNQNNNAMSLELLAKGMYHIQVIEQGKLMRTYPVIIH
jgi:hypothetical protein